MDLPLGTGHSSPVTSAGRLFQFDRLANQARLRAVESETGKLLWQFEYPSEFEDQYNYENGPRASPLVDGERVYTTRRGDAALSRRAVGRTGVESRHDGRFGVVPNFFGVAARRSSLTIC